MQSKYLMTEALKKAKIMFKDCDKQDDKGNDRIEIKWMQWPRLVTVDGKSVFEQTKDGVGKWVEVDVTMAK